jgi:hydrogenase maturation protein HypF
MTPGRVALPFETGKSAIAFGAHLKNTFCITQNNNATISQHLGDIATLERMENYENTLKLYLDLFECKPDLLISDLHPDYKTTQIAEKMSERLKLPLIRVQHHHAHAVSVMAEHKVQKAVAVVFDGMGLGIDGNIWGGEFLLCTYREFTRLAHLENVPLPGGDLAAKNPWRMALGYLEQMKAGQNEFAEFLSELECIHGQGAVNTVRKQIRSGINCPLTSSCGRLFDAAAVLIDHRCKPTYEGQAAMELEALARQCKCREHRLYDFAAPSENNVHIVKSTLILKSMQTALNSGISKACAARIFHQTLSAAISDVLLKVRSNIGVGDICLSGGVFQNTLLLKDVRGNLEECGFNVFTPSIIPANDGGLSFGQAVIGLSNFA